MKKQLKKLLASTMVFIMLMSSCSFILAYAATAIAADEEIVYDDLDALSALGFDTSVMPEEYDADSTENPYGKDSFATKVIPELFISSSNRDEEELSLSFQQSGKDQPIPSEPSEILQGTIISGVQTDSSYIATTVAGDFDGDGMDGEVAVAQDTYSYGWRLNFLDAKTDTRPTPAYAGIKLNASWNGSLASAIEHTSMVAADFDGDGYDEIAYANPHDGSSGSQLFVYKLRRTMSSQPADFKDSDNWSLVWNQYFSPKFTFTAGDVNRDGVEDIILVEVNNNYSSVLTVLFGSKNGDMFHQSTSITMGDPPERNKTTLIGDIVFDDADGDDTDEIVICKTFSYSSTDYSPVQYIGVFDYDIETGTLEVEKESEVKIVDYENGSSINGFDDEYRNENSKENLAIVNFGGVEDSPYIYANGVVYQYKDSNIGIVSDLSDKLDDNEVGNPIYEIVGDSDFIDTGAKAADFTGTGKEVLLVNLQKNWDSSDFNEGIAIIGFENGKFELESITISTMTQSCCLVNTDDDSATMSYTGEHYIEYEDPQVLAVVASAPYFQDVADYDEDGYYLDNSGTEFGSISGSGNSAGSYTGLSAGSYAHGEISAVDCLVFEAGTGYGMDFTFSYEKAFSSEQQLTFGTSPGQDTVAFYSIPMEKYVFNMTVPNINASTGVVEGSSTTEVVISIPRQACVVSMALDKYDEIAEMYPDLPQLSGNAVTHTVGDPATYPQSTAGYNVIAQYNGDWAGVDYGLGYISQEVTVTEEESYAFELGGYVRANVGGGCCLISGAEATVTLGGTWSNTNLSGTTFSGSVGNMPESAREYGYYYAWKLFSYQYTAETANGYSSFPVVSYITTDVTSPKTLPNDFSQYHPLTTSTAAALRWTYSDSAAGFNIYRYYDFPEGGGSYKVGYVPVTDYTYERDGSGEILRDENGMPIKTYTFVDEELNPYTKYDYRIQVVSNDLPFESILSTVLTARTKSSVGSPIIELSSNLVSVFPDTGGAVSVTVRNASAYSEAPMYQWQKFTNNMWTDIAGKESSTLKFTRPDVSVVGQYRCRVNVIYNDIFISEFSDTVKFDYLRRTPVISEISFTDDGTDAFFSVDVTNPYTDSVAAPTGIVRFGVSYMSEELFYDVALVNGKAQLTLPNYQPGAYIISAQYMGNRVFEDVFAENKNVLAGVTEGYFLEFPPLKDIVFLADLTYSVTYISYENGVPVSHTLTDEELDGFSAKYIDNDYSATHDCEVGVIPTAYSSAVLTLYNADNTAVAKKAYDVNPREINVELLNRYVALGEDAPLTFDDYCEYDASLLPPGITLADTGAKLYAKGTKRVWINAVGYSHYENQVLKVTNTETLLPGQYPLELDTSSVRKSRYIITANTATVYVQADAHSVSASVRNFNGIVPGKVALIAPKATSDFTNLKYPSGTYLTFKATPFSGYVVKEWYINGIAQNCSQNALSFTMLSEDVVVEVEYTVQSGTLSYNATGNGTVVCSNAPAMVSGSQAFEGSQWTFEAKASAGYHFKQWRVVYAGLGTSYPAGDINESGNHTYTATMTARNTTVYAVFERDNFVVSYGGNLSAYYIGDHDFNTATPDQVIYIKSGAIIPGDTVVSVTPATGYLIKPGAEWSSNVSGYEVNNETSTLSFTVLANTFVNIETVQQSYSLGEISVACTPETTDNVGSVSATLNGNAFTDFDGGVAMYGGDHLVVTAVPARGYVFASFTVNGIACYDSVLDITVGEDISSIVANFVPNTSYTFTLEKPSSVKVSYSLNGADYVTITEDTPLELFDTDVIFVKEADSETHRLRIWQVDSADFSADKVLSFSDISEDMVISVVEDVSIYNTITGSVEGAVITDSSPFNTSIPYGEEFTVTFKLNEGVQADDTTVIVFGETLTDWQSSFNSEDSTYTVAFAATESGKFEIKAASAATVSVTGVSITPETATMVKGSRRQFSAQVLGANIPASELGVIWSVSGASSADTKVVNGELTIGADETANSVELKATAATDANFSRSISVTVVQETSFVAEPAEVVEKTETTLVISTLPNQEYAIVNEDIFGNFNSGAFEEEWLSGDNGSVTFTSLKANTPYTVVSRIKGSSALEEISPPVNVITMLPAAPAVTAPKALTVVYGTKLSGVILSGGSSNGTFAWADDTITPTVGNSGYELRFTPSDSEIYEYSPEDLIFTVVVPVTPAVAPAVTYPTASPITYGEKLSDSVLTGGSNAGVFAWAAPETVPEVNNNGYSVVFTPNDEVNYTYPESAYTKNVTIAVSKAGAQEVIFPSAADITYGEKLSDSVLSGGSGDGTFAWAAPETVPNVNNNGFTVVFTPNDDLNYSYPESAYSQVVAIKVNKANAPAVVFPKAADITYGQKLSDSVLSEGSKNGSFSWVEPSTAPGVVNSGYSVRFAPNDTDNYTYAEKDLTGTVAIVVNPAAPAAIVWPTASPATYGQTLGSVKLSGGKGDGTFAWQAPNTALTVVNSGYTVMFTPKDSVNYSYNGVVLTKVISVNVARTASQAVPAAPELLAKTLNSISVVTVPGLEYSIDGGKTWNNTGIFKELSENTAYDIVARTAQSANELESAQSTSLNVTTLGVLYNAKADKCIIVGLDDIQYRNSAITFTAVGDGMDNETPLEGDTRFVPVSWLLQKSTRNGYIEEASGSFADGNNSDSVTLKSSEGRKLTVTYSRETFNGSEWVADETVVVKTVEFSVESFFQMIARLIRSIFTAAAVQSFFKVK